MVALRLVISYTNIFSNVAIHSLAIKCKMGIFSYSFAISCQPLQTPYLTPFCGASAIVSNHKFGHARLQVSSPSGELPLALPWSK